MMTESLIEMLLSTATQEVATLQVECARTPGGTGTPAVRYAFFLENILLANVQIRRCHSPLELAFGGEILRNW